MSRLIARILLALLLFPFASLLYFTILRKTALRPPDDYAFSGAVTWTLGGIYWLLLWRGAVRWNALRILGTGIAVAAAVMAGFVIRLYLSDMYEAPFIASV